MRVLFLPLVVLLAAPPVLSQEGAGIPVTSGSPQSTHSVSATIVGYGSAVSTIERFIVTMDSEGKGDAVTAALDYATNRAVGQQVLVRIEGDFDGVVLDVEPVESSVLVERIARGGSSGTFVSSTLSSAGTVPVVVDVGQVVARVDVRYTVRALPGPPRPGPRTFTVTYTVTS